MDTVLYNALGVAFMIGLVALYLATGVWILQLATRLFCPPAATFLNACKAFFATLLINILVGIILELMPISLINSFGGQVTFFVGTILTNAAVHSRVFHITYLQGIGVQFVSALLNVSLVLLILALVFSFAISFIASFAFL